LEKKQPALELAQSMAQRSSDLEPRPDKTEHQFSPGEFVGLVEETSTLDKPIILVGRVLYYVDKTRVSLLWYKATGFSTYDLSFEGETWIEDESAL
jgi:hypothetical protein